MIYDYKLLNNLLGYNDEKGNERVIYFTSNGEVFGIREYECTGCYQHHILAKGRKIKLPVSVIRQVIDQYLCHYNFCIVPFVSEKQEH